MFSSELFGAEELTGRRSPARNVPLADADLSLFIRSQNEAARPQVERAAQTALFQEAPMTGVTVTTYYFNYVKERTVGRGASAEEEEEIKKERERERGREGRDRQHVSRKIRYI